MKDLIIKSCLNPREVVNLVLRGCNIELVDILGNQQHIYRMLRDYKLKSSNPRPLLYPEIGLCEILSKTHNGSQFYQYGPGFFRNFEEFENIIIFFSDEMYEKLRESEVWCIDGTFDVVSRPYFQLFTIGYIKDHHVLPCVFAILKDKTQNTYNNIFKILQY